MRLWLLPQYEGGGEIVEMCDDMDIRWMTDDQKSYGIVLYLPSFYKLLSSRCLVQSLLKTKLAFRNKLHKEPLLPLHIVYSLSKSC